MGRSGKLGAQTLNPFPFPPLPDRLLGFLWNAHLTRQSRPRLAALPFEAFPFGPLPSIDPMFGQVAFIAWQTDTNPWWLASLGGREARDFVLAGHKVRISSSRVFSEVQPKILLLWTGTKPDHHIHKLEGNQ